MSLNWDVSRCADKEALWYEDQNPPWPGTPGRKLRPWAESIIWQCVLLDFGAIRDEADACEFFTRLEIMRALGRGAPMHGPDGPVWHTLAEVRRMIGLTTNVPTRKRGPWLTRILKHVRAEAEQEAERVVREALDR